MRRKIKGITAVLAVLIIISALFNNVRSTSASSDIKLVVNGRDITSLAAPVIVNDRTLVPVRFISEELGATVTWDGEARSVLLEKNEISVFFRIGSYLVEYNDGERYNLSDVAPLIINDRTYVPLRLIATFSV